jgi:hypothetical protein
MPCCPVVATAPYVGRSGSMTVQGGGKRRGVIAHAAACNVKKAPVGESHPKPEPVGVLRGEFIASEKQPDQWKIVPATA